MERQDEGRGDRIVPDIGSPMEVEEQREEGCDQGHFVPDVENQNNVADGHNPNNMEEESVQNADDDNNVMNPYYLDDPLFWEVDNNERSLNLQLIDNEKEEERERVRRLLAPFLNSTIIDGIRFEFTIVMER